LSVKRPSAPLFVCASCFGAPALAAHRVTVELAIGMPPPSTWPFRPDAAAGAANSKLPVANVSSDRRSKMPFLH